MCGIAGWFDDGRGGSRYACVVRMVAAMRHRGPDSSGAAEVSCAPAVSLGQARLAIIDVSPDGHQPMVDPDTGNVIVFNGEIYNFRHLRQELETRGFQFRTHSDTEVLLKAYAAWGEGCCSRLRGIFAFALWDSHGRRLFMARDQLGVKPFYFCQPAGGFAFASEVRALLAAGAAERHVDLQGLNSYLAYGSVQEPYTLIKDIRSLPAGHCATFFEHGLKTARYWSPFTGSGQSAPSTVEAASGEVAACLREAVSLQMIADVPLGAFLSGGIDSSAIVSLMRQTHSGPIKTFSIVFDEPGFDERRYAAAVARQNGTEHIELELTGSLAQANLAQALGAFDQPSLDGLNTWFVSKLVKEAGLTVALSGVGGDELFVGYGGFEKPLAMARWQQRLGWLPAPVGRMIATRAQSEKIRKVGQIMGYPLPAYFLSRQVFSREQSGALLRDACHCDFAEWAAAAFDPMIADARPLDLLEQLSWYELKSYMLSTLLRDTDQMSMAHSLEVRVPLIDHRVVELLLRIPGRFKKDARTPKPLLVHAAGQGLPEACVHRPKQGFVLPFEAWFKGCMRQKVQSFCLGGGSEVFDPAGLAALWWQYEAGHVTWSRIWGLFVLNHWMTSQRITVRLK